MHEVVRLVLGVGVLGVGPVGRALVEERHLQRRLGALERASVREALLHALFRQNYGCSHLLVGRDHAGVGDYYGPFDAHHIFDEIPKDAFVTRPIKIDWTFWCYRCGQMASMRTCPHEGDDRLLLSGTKLRKMLSEGEEVPPEFSRPEVLAILRQYYEGLSDELKGHSAA